MALQYLDSSNSDFPVKQQELSLPQKIVTLLHILLFDIVVYGCLVPLLGTYTGAGIAQLINTSPNFELVLVVITTFILMYVTFCVIGEASYWKHLFAFDTFYSTLLQVRDAINALLAITYITCISSAVKGMIMEDKGIRAFYVSKGAGFVFMKKICDLFYLDRSLLDHIGGKLFYGTTTSLTTSSEQFDNGTAFMLYWALLAACIAKLVYFNTLFTYQRAMEIFISMKPSFPNDDDFEGGFTRRLSDLTFVNGLKSPGGQSCMENDFAQSMKQTKATNRTAKNPNVF